MRVDPNADDIDLANVTDRAAVEVEAADADRVEGRDGAGERDDEDRDRAHEDHDEQAAARRQRMIFRKRSLGRK